MRIIITGALGHIGSYVIRDFANLFPGAELILVDNLRTQRFPSLFNLPVTGRYRFIEADLTKAELSALVTGAHTVIHLAALTDAAGSFERAVELEENNYLCTLRIAEACAKTGTRLIALSSTSVYGTQSEVVAENCSEDELKPQSPYAATKLKEEQLITKLCTEGSLKAVICRFGTIFGTSPGMRFHTAVNKFCWQAVMGQPITVWRTAYDQKRPYLDLSDASRALAYIITNEIWDGNIYNVLSHNMTVKQIVEVIKEFVPALEINFVDNQIMNQLSYEVSNEKFKAKGFVFTGNLRKAIGETISLLSQANSI